MSSSFTFYKEAGSFDGLYCICNEEENKGKPWFVYWQEHGVRYAIENFETEEDALKCVEYRRSHDK